MLRALAPVLAVVALAVCAVQSSLEQHGRRAELLTENLASALMHSVSAEIEKIDIALITIADLAQQQLAARGLEPPALGKVVNAQSLRHPGLRGIRIVAAEGATLVGESRPGEPPLNMADRDGFITQRSNAAGSLVMSAPLLRKVDGSWAVSFSRRIVDSRGAFAGVVSASLPLASLQHHLQSIDVDPHGVVMLRDGTNRLLARQTRDAGPAVTPIGSRELPPALQALMGSDATQGSLRAVPTPDNFVRTVTFTTVRNAPLRVMVALATADYVSSTSRNCRGIGARWWKTLCRLWRAMVPLPADHPAASVCGTGDDSDARSDQFRETSPPCQKERWHGAHPPADSPPVLSQINPGSYP